MFLFEGKVCCVSKNVSCVWGSVMYGPDGLCVGKLSLL